MPTPMLRSSELLKSAAVTRRPLLSDQIASTITETMIADGLRAGDRLPTEPELAEKYGVSRTVIREAGRLLVDRGLVSIRAGRGMAVRDFDGTNLARQYELILKFKRGSFVELMELRIALEVEMAGLAALRHTDGDVADIGSTLDAFTDLVAHGNALRADLSFHRALAAASHNPFFIYATNPINTYLRRVYSRSLGYEAARGRTFAEHRDIAGAVAASDAAAAREAAKAHLVRIREMADDLVSTESTSGGRTGSAQ